MTSQSLLYVVVLPLAWVVFRFVQKTSFRQLFLLAVSYLLYASWGLGFLALLVASSAANYYLGRWLRDRQSSVVLWLAIALNVALLGVFKYAAISAPLLTGTRWADSVTQLIQPIGISFWTFQALSYLMDVYRGDALEPSFTEFLLYMAFWPTVLSGPICRLSQLLPQLRNMKNPDRSDVTHGLDRVCLGLLMIGIGQILAAGIHGDPGIDAAFDKPVMSLGGADVWTLAFGYGFELFFNFAGYSHLVIGAAGLFGFVLPENFNCPYLALSPSEFWTRWHMSLSSWIRDYLFLPLAMLGNSKVWRNAALVLSMLVFGLWHKGSALLALWGLYQGVLLVVHRQWQELTRRWKFNFPGTVSGFLSWLATITSICFGWILFRADSLRQAFAMMKGVAVPSAYGTSALPRSLYFLVLLVLVGYLVAVALGPPLRRLLRGATLVPELRFALYSMAFYVGVLHATQNQAFIYFKF